MKILPDPDDVSAFYWDAAARGVLEILGCSRCGGLVHPPRTPCPRCGGSDLAPTRVSGRGTVYAVTVSHHKATGRTGPFALALVSLAEDPRTRILCEIRGPAPASVAIGTPVEVEFEEVGEGVRLPQFREVVDGASGL